MTGLNLKVKCGYCGDEFYSGIYHVFVHITRKIFGGKKK